MSEKHMLMTALEYAEKDSTKDFQLRMLVDDFYIAYFKKTDDKGLLQNRLETLRA